MPSGKKKTQCNVNFPKDNAEKWAEFKSYCKQDVEAERAIRKRLEKYEIIGVEKRLWQLDQAINNNGVWIDMELVRGAIKIAEIIRAEAMSRSEKITGGLNLNSNAQIRQWIEGQEGLTENNSELETPEKPSTANRPVSVFNPTKREERQELSQFTPLHTHEDIKPDIQFARESAVLACIPRIFLSLCRIFLRNLGVNSARVKYRN